MKTPKSPESGRRTVRLRVLTALLLLSAGWVAAPAQTPQPRREQLLNGLRILLWSRPADQNVLVKVRVHSGAAFDLAGREGLMASLADLMFDQQTRDYVTEELGGRIEVAVGYDTLDITLAGRATDLERLLELARNAVTNPQLTPEVFERVRAARVKSLRETQPTAAEAAERAAAPVELPSPRDAAVEALALDPLELAIGFGLVPLVDQHGGGTLLARVSTIRRQIASEKDLGSDVADQLLDQRKAPLVAGAVICAFALVPALPKVPFLLIGGMFFFVGWMLRKQPTKREAEEAEKAQAALAAPAAEAPAPRDAALDALALDPLELAIGFGLVPLVDQHGGGTLLARVSTIRRQ
ncbi:MAG: FHIPEP family type III secretion protein, partial [Pyrinomonadaceae bacterium]